MTHHLLIAQTTPPAGTAEWLAVLFFLLGGVAVVLKIVDHFRAKPPLHNQFADREETEKRFDTLERKVEALRIEARTQYDDLLRAGEARAIKIHDRINMLADRVGELIGAVNLLIKRP